MVFRNALTLASVLVVAGCTADVEPSAPGDGRDDAIAISNGKADTGGISPGGLVSQRVLAAANLLSRDALRWDVGLDERAADNIAAYRVGDDGVVDTDDDWTDVGDDELFETLAELDAIPYVGPIAFQQLASFAENDARFRSGCGDQDVAAGDFTAFSDWYRVDGLCVQFATTCEGADCSGAFDSQRECQRAFRHCPSPQSPPSNDACGDVPVVTSGDTVTGTFSGDAELAPEADAGICDFSQRPFGAERVFAIDLRLGETLEVEYMTDGWGTVAYIMTDCADTSTCVSNNPAWWAGILEYVAEADERIYVVIDHTNGGQWDTYDISFEVR